MAKGLTRPRDVAQILREEAKVVDERGALSWRQMRLDEGKIIPWYEAFYHAETAGVLAEDLAEILIAGQPAPIQIKGLLNATGEQSLLNQKLILIQNRRVAGFRLRSRFEARRQPCAHGFVDRFRLRSQKIAKELAEERMS
jgi:hypothetical protein